MFALVELYRQSGKSRRAFCLEHGLNPSTFRYWVRRDQKKPEPSGGGFLPVNVSGPAFKAGSVEICYPNGVRISVPIGDSTLIAKLIRLY